MIAAVFNMGRPRLSKFKGMKRVAIPVIGTPQMRWLTLHGIVGSPIEQID